MSGVDHPVEVFGRHPVPERGPLARVCIDKALAAFKAGGVCGEVVGSDNGSTDGSIHIAEEHGAGVVHAEIRG